MGVIAQRLRALRESVHLSQAKLAGMIGTTQASIGRYETGQAAPSVKILLWYADFFDVSLDYIFGRTKNPHGIAYTAEPKIIENQSKDNRELQQFIEMCFDPQSPMSVKLKQTLYKMMMEEKG